MHESKSYVEDLDLIAINEGEIVGHIISTKAEGRVAFFEDSAFEFEKIELDEFDKQFPLKEKGSPKIDLNHN
jgi:hypothetical protein